MTEKIGLVCNFKSFLIPRDKFETCTLFYCSLMECPEPFFATIELKNLAQCIKNNTDWNMLSQNWQLVATFTK